MMQLNNDYQRDDFLKFLEEDFLTDFKRDIRPVNTSSLSSIQKASYLGESKGLDLQVFEFSFEGSPNKRVALTKDAFSVMRSSAIYNALAVFHSPDKKDWRFSLMTATPEPTEKGKVSLSYSNPKRLSFFLGPNAKINTPTKFLINKGKIVDLEDLKSRFSIEVVNKEFYKEISQTFTKLVNGLLKLPSTQDKSQTNLEFAVRLIGRVIFCWFLREKKSEAGLALMPKELLSFEAVKKNEDYYHKILEPIFFEILNKPVKSRREDFAKEPFSSVSYLNGGLFSPQEDDYYKRSNGDFQSQHHNTLVVPDSWIKSFFEILETYNFTIDENTSYDEELSIDPEMLGRIFENLLAEINPETGESARKSTGSYYTPRVIVNYMVDESLLLYLKEQTGIKEEKLKAIISYDLDDDVESPITPDDKEKIIDALEKVKILDPACGSGAFPIGALQKIVFILQQTDSDGQLWFKKQIKNTSPEIRRVIEREFEHENFDYIRKLGIIRENIYGVDIQPIATEISRLRCFLTLIVDERIQDESENRGIEPLPNLDFKFVTANSLIGLPKIDLNQKSMFDDYQKIDDLKNIRDQYFNASGIEREQLKTEFVMQQKRLVDQLIKEHGFMGVAKAELTQKLTDWEPFTHKSTSWFDPEWMFGIKDGFNVVIANPPYIEFKKMKLEIKKCYSNYLSAKGKFDIYVLFLELASNNLKPHGILTFINPTTFLQKDFGGEIRKFIRGNLKIVNILDFNDFQVFSNVTNYTGIFIFEKVTCDNYEFDYHRYSNSKIAIGYQDFAASLGSTTPQTFKKYIKTKSVELSKTRWIFEEPVIALLLRKIESDTTSLQSLSVSIFQGIASGKDDVFYITEEIISKYNLEKDILHKLIKGRDIKAYCITWSGTYVVYPYGDDSKVISEDRLVLKYPNIYKYLVDNKSLLQGRSYFDNSTKSWYELWNQRQLSNFGKRRIVVSEISDKNNFALTDKYFGNTKTYNIILKDPNDEECLYTLGLLNSSLLTFYYQHITTPHAGGFFAYKTQFLNTVPIKNVQSKDKRPIVEFVNNILDDMKSEDYSQNPAKQTQVKEYEKQIDQLIYKLYGLTKEEIQLVDNYA